MLAAHHFQLADQSIRDLFKEHPEDPFVRDMYAHIGWDGPGISDSHAYEVWKAPGKRWEIIRGSVDIYLHCESVGTTEQRQRESQSLCDNVANPALGSLCQDLEDAVDLDHCEDAPRAQAPHFMRATSQSTGDAYHTAVRWIQTNVESAAAGMASRRDAGQKSSTNGLPSRDLGRAIHALQDSFSEAHALRESVGGLRTGQILHLFAYKTQDHKEHGKLDLATVNKGVVYDTFSPIGRVVIEAGKELIWLAVRMAKARTWLAGDWNVFQNSRLVLSPNWEHYSDDRSA